MKIIILLILILKFGLGFKELKEFCILYDLHMKLKTR